MSHHETDEYSDQKEIDDDDRPGEFNQGDVREEEEEEDDEISELDRYWPPPVDETVQITSSHQPKTILAFSFNNCGTRFAAAGYEHDVRIWSFETLDKTHPEPINNVQPCGQTVIKHVEFSNDDELILVIPGNSQAVITAKDGTATSNNNKYKTCPKGDQYISDMTNTKGHVQTLNDGCWAPKDNETFITCSNDATIRIWDLNNLSQHKNVIKTKSPVNGLKTIPNVSRFSRDGLTIIAGCNDGSIMMWDTRRKFISTSSCIRNAHFKGSEITGIDYNYAMNKVCSRSEDESCKIWDLRQLKQALATRTGLSTSYSTTDCQFSPDDKFVITGESHSKQVAGQLHFLDSIDLTTQSSIVAEQASVIRTRWHPKINHIGYSCSNGLVFVAHDPKRSIGGFSTSGGARGTKRKKYVSQASLATGVAQIITPHSLPLFREDQSSSSLAKIRRDPKRSYKPEMPAVGVTGSRPAGSTLSSYIAKNIAKPVDDGGMNIRDRILRHASEVDGIDGKQKDGQSK